MDNRYSALLQWLDQSDIRYQTIDVASSDASFRRYFRLHFADGKTLIAMDAPPSLEPCDTFLDLAQQLEHAGIKAPRVEAYDLEQGFMLLSDLGKTHLEDKQSSSCISTYYQGAIDQLVRLQERMSTASLDSYSTPFLLTEMKIFTEWYVQKHLNIALSDHDLAAFEALFQQIAHVIQEQPQTFVHRDFHCRNLMLDETTQPALIDFQGALKGPVTYDIVSLLRDCYIYWPTDHLTSWLDYFCEKNNAQLAGATRQDIQRWFDWTGLQRHIKCVGIFARLKHRDHKSTHMAAIPRTLFYIETIANQYPELSALQQLLTKHRIRSDFQP